MSSQWTRNYSIVSRPFWIPLNSKKVPKILSAAQNKLNLIRQIQRIAGTRSFFWGTRQERMHLNSERNEAGTDASKIRGTQKGTARSFSVPFASKFGQIFSKFSIIYTKIGRNINILLQNIYFIMKSKSGFEKYAKIQIYLQKISHG